MMDSACQIFQMNLYRLFQITYRDSTIHGRRFVGKRCAEKMSYKAQGIKSPACLMSRKILQTIVI